MAKHRYASNGKRDIHGLEHEFNSAFDSLLTENWTFDCNRLVAIE